MNRVGRPLGVATSTSTVGIPTGGLWSFETEAIAPLGDTVVAFPAASISN
jgi:hypothetical protein